MTHIAMVPPEVRPDIDAVTAASATLGTDTPRYNAGIVSSEHGIGAGTLGQAFRGRHMATSQAVQADAVTLPGVFQQLSEAGQAAVRDYEQADAAAAQGYRNGLTPHHELHPRGNR